MQKNQLSDNIPSLKNKVNVAILTNIIPAYREGFYDRLFASDEINATVFCQDSVPGSGFKMNEEKYENNLQIFKYWSLGNAKLVWQFLPVRKLLRDFDVLVVDGNIRHISQALFSFIAKLSGKKVVIWSSVNHPGKSKLEWVRLKWWKLFNHFLMYTEDDVKDLKAAGFEDKSFVSINNGLDQKKLNQIIDKWSPDKLQQWIAGKELQDRKIIISSGRLQNNKYDTALNVLPQLVKKIPNLLWVVVGDGADRKKMEQTIHAQQLSEHVHFLGAVFDDEILTPWFLSANIFIHPGAVGLSIMHAFGYGLPIITHDDTLMHGPEFIIFKDSETGLSFTKGNEQQFADAVIKLLENESLRKQMQANTKQLVQESYNVDVMFDRFTTMINRVHNKKKLLLTNSEN